MPGRRPKISRRLTASDLVAVVEYPGQPFVRAALVSSFLAPLLLVAACGTSSGAGVLGGGGLSAGDKRVCADAVQNDTVAVYLDGPGATNGDITQQVSMITQSSPPDVDARAIQTIVQICRNHGYNVAGSAGLGGTVGTSSSPTGTPTPSAATFLKPPVHGLLECGLLTNRLDVLAMADPNTGRVIWTQAMATPSISDWSATGNGCGVCCPPPLVVYGTAPYDTENYTSDFRRVTATNSNGAVGWIDVASGDVTNVSERVPTPSPGFGQAPSKDSSPLFDPKDNSFWFERTASDGTVSVLRVQTINSIPQVVSPVQAGDRWVISSSGALINLSALARSEDAAFPCGIGATGIPCIASNSVAVNPSGSVALACSLLYDPPSCFVVSPLNSNWRSVSINGPDAANWVPPTGLGYGWVSESQLMGSSQSGNCAELYTPTGSSLSVATLIPTSGASCSNFVVSPDGTSALFLAAGANTGNVPYLYKISLSTPGSQPQQIGLAPAIVSAGITSLQLGILGWR